jgi:uncharacterized protein (TIGR02466 family)
MIEHIFSCPIYVDKINLKLLNKVNKIIKKHKTNFVSNVGGYQSPSIKTTKDLTELFANINIKISQFYKRPLKFQSYWINKNNKYNYNKPHNHPGCLVSGVYYVNVPEDSGDIIFHAPYSDLVSSFMVEKDFHDLYIIKPKTNMLLLFPSWLKHSVEMSKSSKSRLSIAFNYS